MKNTWRILAAVTALSLAACPGDDDEDGDTGTSGSCTGTFSGAVTGTVRSCTVTAAKLATNGELIYTITVEPAAGSGTVKNVDDIILSLSGEPTKGTFSGTTIREATGSVYSTDQEKQYDLQLGFGEASTLGSATLVIDAVPTGQDEGADTYYEGFGGRAQIRYEASPTYSHTGTVDLSLTFKR
jgi:hypothetical protein